MKIPWWFYSWAQHLGVSPIVITHISGRGAHVDLNVDKSGSLGDLPVKPSGGRGSGHLGKIDLEVTDGFEEVLWKKGQSESSEG